MEEGYAEQMGKHGRVAARRASEGDEKTALARAADAARERDLLHPDGWDLWEQASDELFEKALERVSREELEKLPGAKNARGASWAAVFAGSPAKLKALMGRGLDPHEALCRMPGGVLMEAAVYWAWFGEVGKLCAMMDAGMRAPAALSRKESVELDPSDPRTAAHLLARCSSRAWHWGEKPDAAQLERVMGWLFSETAGKRNERGYDALKYAIREGSSEVIMAALANGANPGDRDAKGLDAFELLLKTMGEPAGEEGRSRARRLAEALPRLRSAQEAREIKAATGAAPSAPKSTPRM